MKAFMITAMNSGSGKTVLSCTLMRAFRSAGRSVAAFKCGPDYIDPMFHRRVLGLPSENLDVFLMGEDNVTSAFRACTADLAILEGAMGFYDGKNGTTFGSASHVADLCEVPVVLCVKPGGTSITLAAQLQGMLRFRKNRICAVIFNDCSESLFRHLKPIIERETGLCVLGYLPHTQDAVFESRHLGLVTAEEIVSFSERFDRLAALAEQHIDLNRLLELCEDKSPVLLSEPEFVPHCKIAVARDEAFCFYYEANLSALKKAGAELIDFSPLRDSRLPEADALYLGGGYPELYASALSANQSMLRSIRAAAEKGMPLVAECGGFMYLQQTLEGSDGVIYPMCGVLSGECRRTDRLQRFGYLTLRAEEDSLLLRQGERLPAHEFHYWNCSINGSSFTAEKEDGRSYVCGVGSDSFYAAFPHLHFNSTLPIAERFVSAAEHFRICHE